MAKTTPTAANAPPKLPRLPKGAKISKRPLLHPPIVAPRSGRHQQKVIYMSATTPFISSVKRVRKYLSEIDARAAGKMSIVGGPGSRDRPELHKVVGKGAEERKQEEVCVKATGKAVDRALRLALFFQADGGVVVRLRTGSVGAVDDVLVRGGEDDADPGGQEGEELPEARVRRTNGLWSRDVWFVGVLGILENGLAASD